MKQQITTPIAVVLAVVVVAAIAFFGWKMLSNSSGTPAAPGSNTPNPTVKAPEPKTTTTSDGNAQTSSGAKLNEANN